MNSTYNDDNSCIICLEESGELLENFFCDCRFKFHTKCYRDWLIKSQSRKCMVCFKDYTSESIVDFLGNLTIEEPNISIPVAQSYDIVPYDTVSETSDDYDSNILIRRTSCLTHMPGLIIILITFLFIIIIILMLSMSGT